VIAGHKFRISRQSDDPVVGMPRRAGTNKGCEGGYSAGIIRIELREGFLILARSRRLARLAVRQSAA
jgi:hypothetical protein